MKYYNKVIFFILIFFLFLYFSIGLVFYLHWAQPKIPYVNTIPKVLGPISNILSSRGVSKLYYFNPKVFTSDKNTFLLDFSRNDIIYKDSIFKLINSGDIKILEDRFKKWRNFNVIENENGISSKFKLHGSSVSPYLNGYESFTIKSKYPINGYKNFKLINSLEMNYFNIFLNHIGKKFSLIAEDTGDIVAVNSLSKIRDFFQYEMFDENYLISAYNIINPTIIRRNTFNDGINIYEWHSSDLDKISYNIDSDFISENDYIFWKLFNEKTESSQFDQNYMGSFFSLIQLFGHPHQITGNNDKWVIHNNKIYPVYRNEGNIIPVSANEIQKNMIFEKYYYSSSLEIYKKILTDNSVVNYRNLAFKKIVDNKENIIKDLDSIYLTHEKIHLMYNEHFLKLKFKHIHIKNTLINNINAIEKFLNGGFTILYFNGNELRITSTRNNKLEIKVNNKTFEFFPTILNYDQENKKLEFINNELVIKGVRNIIDLEITDKILNNNLEIEKDYTILSSN